MIRIALIRPGSTAFDEEGRIKGCLDIPLSEGGRQQARQVASELATQIGFATNQPPLAAVYAAPCQSAQATAEIIADVCRARLRTVDCMVNVNHGLWQGKLIDDVRRLQPKVYRQIQDFPEAFSPPGGETLDDAQSRIRKSLSKLVKKHRNGFIALVVPDPLASLARQLLVAGELGNLWKAEKDFGSWEMIAVESDQFILV